MTGYEADENEEEEGPRDQQPGDPGLGLPRVIGVLGLGLGLGH